MRPMYPSCANSLSKRFMRKIGRLSASGWAVAALTHTIISSCGHTRRKKLQIIFNILCKFVRSKRDKFISHTVQLEQISKLFSSAVGVLCGFTRSPISSSNPSTAAAAVSCHSSPQPMTFAWITNNQNFCSAAPPTVVAPEIMHLATVYIDLPSFSFVTCSIDRSINLSLSSFHSIRRHLLATSYRKPFVTTCATQNLSNFLLLHVMTPKVAHSTFVSIDLARFTMVAACPNLAIGPGLAAHYGVLWNDVALRDGDPSYAF